MSTLSFPDRIVLVSAGLPVALRRAAGACRARLLSWQVRRRDLRHLRQLDDWQLADIGLTRDTLEPAVRGDFDPHRGLGAAVRR